jgi:uncharacterized membrane protein
MQLVGLALLAGLFIGGIILMVVHDIALAAMFGGGAFVVTILTLAMIVLTMSPELPPKPTNNPHD